jgi:galactokinase
MLGLAKSTAERFVATYGRQPDGVWQAPGRVNLIGEHTDYNQGFVLPMAINLGTCAAVALRDDSQRIATSTFDSGDWRNYPLGVAQVLGNLSGFELFIESEVPVGAGLSSSAAIECSVALALNELWALGLDRTALAKAGQRAENEVVGAPTGVMDQMASLHGKADHAVFLDCRSLEAKPVELGFDAAGLELIIIDTRVAHRLVDGGYAARRAACERGAAVLGVESLRDLSVADLPRAESLLDNETFRRVRHVITENQRVLDFVAALGDWKTIGELMLASHASMRDDFEISVDELDTAVDVAMRHGAIGSRMTGGGFGGAAIALTPRDRIGELTNAVKAEFELLGYAEPNIFTVTAADGGSRVI